MPGPRLPHTSLKDRSAGLPAFAKIAAIGASGPCRARCGIDRTRSNGRASGLRDEVLDAGRPLPHDEDRSGPDCLRTVGLDASRRSQTEILAPRPRPDRADQPADRARADGPRGVLEGPIDRDGGGPSLPLRPRLRRRLLLLQQIEARSPGLEARGQPRDRRPLRRWRPLRPAGPSRLDPDIPERSLGRDLPDRDRPAAGIRDSLSLLLRSPVGPLGHPATRTAAGRARRLSPEIQRPTHAP